MSSIRSVDVGNQLDWLSRSTERRDPIHRVDEGLPPGFEAYLRLFHPFVPWDWDSELGETPPRTRTWRSLAEACSVVFHAELTWPSLLSALPLTGHRRPWAVNSGWIDEPVRSHLFGVLADISPTSIGFFYYGLSRLVGGFEPVLLIAPLDAFVEVDAEPAVVRHPPSGPEFLWPEDRAWVLWTDYDLSSSYLACSRALSKRLVEDEHLEVLEVTRQTRIDDGADIVNGHPAEA
ncbi:MAG: hypothetical protein L0227_19185 [Chloroflexi bacterium]|nr:hypothetical protein [Chloroflexota bacterium]